MIYYELLKEIDRFVELMKELFPDIEVLHSGSKEYLVKECWVGDRWVKESPQFFNENGIYFYLTDDEEVLYIGKADQDSSKGIGNRACGSIGKPDMYKPEDDGFQIKNGETNRQLNQELSSKIKKGNFYISGSVVKPSYLSCLLEVFALSKCNGKDRVLPMYNKKIC